jgi:hypothetical protein
MFQSHKRGFGASGVIFCAFFTFAAVACAGTYSGGSGTAADPYRISTVADWQELTAASADWDKNLILDNDIDLAGASLTPVASDTNPFYPGFPGIPFSGVFDGNGHIIRNAKITDWGSMGFPVGLFGRLQDARIVNLGVENVSFSGWSSTGGIVGYNQGGKVINCSMTGIVSSDNSSAGGIVGSNYQGDIIDCYSICSAVVSSRIDSCGGGGLVGSNNQGRILNCFSLSNISASYGNKNCGGLVGSNVSGGIITNCYAIVQVKGNENVGGLVGMNSGSNIRLCYAKGEVVGGRIVGGLVGLNTLNGEISQCYSEGTVAGTINSSGIGSYVGGLVGDNYLSVVQECYTITTVSGRNGIGGLSGINGGDILDSYASGSVSGYDWTGGLLGYNERGNLTNCFATGNVNGEGYVGGLCGSNDEYGIITNCYATGDVKGQENVGGLCGANDGDGMIISCYSTGYVIGTGSTIGGFLGFNQPGSDQQTGVVTACFWNISLSGQATSAAGIGKTTAEMMYRQTFVGWGPLWTLHDGQDFPRLYWENTEGEPFRLFSGGLGTKEYPFQISTVSDWLDFMKYPTTWIYNFIMTSDIDLKGITVTPIAPNTGTLISFYGMPYTMPFCGVFDGRGHTIRNVVINLPWQKHVGLFGFIRNGYVRNLRLEVNITAYDYIGGLAGYTSGGEIANCHVTGTVSGRYNVTGENIGGLVGRNGSDFVRDCSTAGNVNGGMYVGGLIGNNWSNVSRCSSSCTVQGSNTVGGLLGKNENHWGGTVTSCYATGSVSGYNRVGGLVGNCYSGNVSGCYATGAITGDSSSNFIGGFAGYIESGPIRSCYAKGTAKGKYSVGGFVGSARGSIFTSYSCGSVNGYQGSRNIGAFLGQKEYSDTTISSCFWNSNSSGTSTSAGGTGITVTQMKILTTFTSSGWDFVGESANGTEDVWRMCGDGISYPRLSWEFARGGDMDCPDRVEMEDLLYLAGRWMAGTPATVGAADVDGNGKVDLSDFGVMAENWGRM